jgi:hypothetical protein
VLLSATVYSIAMVAQKVVLGRIPARQMTWLACLIGTVACLPFAGALIRDLSVAPTLQILGVVYLGLVPTALAFSTWAYALSHTSAGNLVSQPLWCRQSPSCSGGCSLTRSRQCSRSSAVHSRWWVWPLPAAARDPGETAVSVPSGM